MVLAVLEHGEIHLDMVAKGVLSLYESARRDDPARPRTIGIEDELLLVDDQGNMGKAENILWYLVNGLGWEGVFDDQDSALLVGARWEHGEVTTDAGLGTLEWVSPPAESLLDLEDARRKTLDFVIDAAMFNRQRILGVGRQPLTPPSRDAWYPKGRYAMLTDRFGSRIHQATVCASTQTHVGTRSLSEQLMLTRAFLAASGALTAMAANASVYEGRAHPDRLASRQFFWQDFAPADRVGVPPYFPTDPAEYADLLAGLDCVFRSDQKGDYRLSWVPFREEMVGIDPASERFRRNAMMIEGTYWLDARPRFPFGTVEVRPCCQQPQGTGLAFPALILGLAENGAAFQAWVALASWEDWRMSRDAAARHGMACRVGKYSMRELAGRLIEIAREGLHARGLGEEVFLQVLEQRLVEGPPALHQIAAFEKGGMKELVRQFSYRY